jgi:hypothetical protein
MVHKEIVSLNYQPWQHIRKYNLQLVGTMDVSHEAIRAGRGASLCQSYSAPRLAGLQHCEKGESGWMDVYKKL